MAGRRRKTLDEQIQVFDEQIQQVKEKQDNLKKKIKELEAQRQELLDQKRVEEVQHLYTIMEEKGVSVSEIEKIIDEREKS